ncbi:MAG: filamentous hemagglutinin N-terminal domain-containing protein, partial [Comamonadaceae bacterium]
MNKSYRLIYNEVTNTWVAVAETAKARGKRAAGAVLLAAASSVLGTAPAYAAPPTPPAATQLPTGGQVVAGQAGIVQNAATLNVNQTSNRAAIDWATFNVGSQAQVNFNQPGSSSVTLNRVLDVNPSQIFGKISAPGQVFLTNPSGVYFAPSASVDVGGLVATTHSISNEDFMTGGSSFTRNGATGSIVNEGHLSAALGGYIALLAPEVRNQGVIVAQLGTVA